VINVKIIVPGPLFQKFPELASAATRFQIARDIMDGARAHLVKLASERLHSTRSDYIAGIQPIARDGKSVVLALVGVLPNMVEGGWDGGFLQETLLGDDAKGWKLSAEGFRYRSIPFRHKTPGAGPQGGQPMGSQYGANKNPMSNAAPHAVVEDTRALGKKIHGAAKKLITKTEAGAGAKGHSRLPSGVGGIGKLRPHHSTDIYAGMIVNKQAVQKKGGGVGFQKTYTTFRTISEAVPDKWFHPGIQARHFMDDVSSYIEKVAPAAIEAFVQEMMKP
jgi:hypothetical protein